MYASIRYCNVTQDHYMVDRFIFKRFRSGHLQPQIDTRVRPKLCDVRPGSLQTPFILSIEVRLGHINRRLFFNNRITKISLTFKLVR